jgi:predicted  nucleic acid-binding Zn-ribbon protein
VTPDLEALLALQSEDDVVDGIQARLDALAPRLAALDAERERTLRALKQAQSALEADEKKKRELDARLSEHKQKQERNLAQLELVKRMREATAAMSQVESGRKMLLEGENEIRDLSSRIAETRRSIEHQQKALAELETAQSEMRESIAAERTTLDQELKAARGERDGIADRVPTSLRSKYDRIRGRRHSQAVFALTAGACSACDTAIPVQRRNVMSHTGAIDLCEACGVLLYATE